MQERDRGEHSLGAVWRRERLTCPTREQLGSYLLQVLDEGEQDYLDFHLNVIGCPYCVANLADLQALQQEPAPRPRAPPALFPVQRQLPASLPRNQERRFDPAQIADQPAALLAAQRKQGNAPLLALRAGEDESIKSPSIFHLAEQFVGELQRCRKRGMSGRRGGWADVVAAT